MVRMIAEDGIDALSAWLARAGLRGEPEATLVTGFCERAAAAGLPISRALVLIDTLHPIYEGRVVRWGHDPSQPVVQEYGRTGLPEGVSDLRLSAGTEQQPDVGARWRASPFFRMLQTGESLLRRRVSAESEIEFPVLRDYRAAGMTEYVAMVDRFAPEGIIGEDGLRLLLVDHRAPRRLRRCRYRSAHARGPDARAGGQGGRARTHDQDLDGDLSRP
jgi:adenylate cyclase